MNKTVTIRPVEAADQPAWLPLWLGYNRFYGREGPMALDPAITAETWRRFLDPTEPVHALVAMDDDAAVGLAHFLFHRSTTALGPVCYLQDLFTEPAHRGRGIARALIQATARAARKVGAEELYWQTHETNAHARRLYDRVAAFGGFIVYEMPMP